MNRKKTERKQKTTEDAEVKREVKTTKELRQNMPLLTALSCYDHVECQKCQSNE